MAGWRGQAHGCGIPESEDAMPERLELPVRLKTALVSAEARSAAWGSDTRACLPSLRSLADRYPDSLLPLCLGMVETALLLPAPDRHEHVLCSLRTCQRILDTGQA
jgi:hypothetical protein